MAPEQTSKIEAHIQRVQGRGYLGTADDLNAVVAALRQLLDERKWRPIESAPRDGTPIILFHKFWKSPVCAQWKVGFVSEMPWVEATKTTAWPFDAFSHWMPLPAAPAVEEHGNGTA